MFFPSCDNLHINFAYIRYLNHNFKVGYFLIIIIKDDLKIKDEWLHFLVT